jgi:acyl-CoA reductase-like NAD-dependent aldehyde dehydrogenase
MPIEERMRLLRRAAELIKERRDKLARLITTEMGKLIREARRNREMRVLRKYSISAGLTPRRGFRRAVA